MIYSKRRYNAPESAQVQKVQKSTHYTITPIGGPQELAAWRLDQVRKEDEWQAQQAEGRANRRARALAMITGDLNTSELTSLEKAEINYRRNRNKGNDLLATCTSREVAAMFGLNSPPRPTLKARVFGFFAKMWKNAFDNT